MKHQEGQANPGQRKPILLTKRHDNLHAEFAQSAVSAHHRASAPRTNRRGASSPRKQNRADGRIPGGKPLPQPLTILECRSEYANEKGAVIEEIDESNTVTGTMLEVYRDANKKPKPRAETTFSSVGCLCSGLEPLPYHDVRRTTAYEAGREELRPAEPLLPRGQIIKGTGKKGKYY